MGEKRTYSLLLLAAGLVTGWLWTGCRRSEPLLHPPINEPQIKAFFDAKEAQARQLVRQENKELPPEIWPFFEAGKKGDWATVTNLYAKMASRCYQFSGNETYDERMMMMAWHTINETDRFYLQCTQPDSHLVLAFSEEIMRLVPPGSIYFGDTDTGRFVPTALCKNQAAGDPFFVFTQNQLCHFTYLNYLHYLSGKFIHFPTGEEISDAHNTVYIEAAEKASEESATDKSHNSVLTAIKINSLISRKLFERNLGRTFFVNEGFPTQWIYPHAEPHGLIIKINRQKPSELTTEMIQLDREYWNKQVAPLIGDWIKEETTLSEICGFVEKVYVREDFTGFKGDTNFTRMATFWHKLPAYNSASANWSKCRSAIAGIYVWRINDCAEQIKRLQQLPPEELVKKQADINHLLLEQQRYIKEADYAYRQAFALNPSSPEAVFRYSSLLTSMNRHEEALEMVQVAKKLNPEAMEPLQKSLQKAIAEKTAK